MSSSFDLIKTVQQAQQSSQVLLDIGAKGREQLLRQLASLIAQYKDDILDANTLDLEASREMAVPSLMLDWLRLTPERVQAVSQLLEALAHQPDPLQQVSTVGFPNVRTQRYHSQGMPLGVIGLVYESFPDLSAIAAGICIKSGNALLLKGGAEASHSNQMIANLIQAAIANTEGKPKCVHLLPVDQSDLSRELLTLRSGIQLIIPYGRPSLIQHVTKQATVPVLQTAIGNCYLYCSDSEAIDLARQMVIDSYQSEPDAINAIDKVIFHQNCSLEAVVRLIEHLQTLKYCLKVAPEWSEQFPTLPVAQAEEWSSALLNFSILLKPVKHISEATFWINQNSSGHSNCIATSSYQESRLFEQNTMSDLVYVNTSPKFERHPKCGDIALGMAKHARGWGGPIVPQSLTYRKLIVHP
ncbi:MAG: aldehyde dehydrogenase family protein [Leptolyngbyaceae bacterium]|nr:aldehyde dehydrogenase family protein [Leptolyngbyaceae bacterium]